MAFPRQPSLFQLFWHLRIAFVLLCKHDYFLRDKQRSPSPQCLTQSSDSLRSLDPILFTCKCKANSARSKGKKKEIILIKEWEWKISLTLASLFFLTAIWIIPAYRQPTSPAMEKQYKLFVIWSPQTFCNLMWAGSSLGSQTKVCPHAF